MKKFSFLLISFILFLLIGCSKDAVIQPKQYPYLFTQRVSDITDNSVVFNGNIASLGKSEIIEYGFLWGSMPEPKIDSSNKTMVEVQIKTGIFSKKIDFQLFKDKAQFVRAYIKTSNLIIYGNTIGFTSNGGIPAVINEVNPHSGYVNSIVRIDGKNFSPDKADNRVFFGDIEAVIDSCSVTSLFVKVPDIDIDIDVYITVEVFGKAVKSAETFRAFTYWKKIAQFPGAERYGSTAFSISNKGYVGLGNQIDGNYFNDFYEYDQANNIWVKKADFPGGARKYAIGFSFNGKGYIGFGYANYQYFHDLWEYDPGTDIWTKIAENPNLWTFADAFFVIGSDVYILSQQMVFKYDITHNGFIPLGYPQGNYRYFTVGFSANNKGYVFAGQEGSGNKLLKDLWEFNPTTNIWKKISELKGNKFRDSPIGFSLNSRLFMGMGRYYNDMYEYIIPSQEFVEMECLPAKGRGHSVSFTIGSKAYIGTGLNDYSNQCNDFYEFNPYKQ